MRRSATALLPLALLAPALARATEARLVGDATWVVASDLIATEDEGWWVAGKLPTPQWGTFHGLVMRGDPDDSGSWAARVPLVPLEAVAGLPDGGALIAGGSWMARLGAGGSVAWQAEWNGAAVHDVACAGWDCVAGGDGFVARLDGATGAVEWTAQSEGPPDIVVSRVLWLSSGDLLLGLRISADEISTSAVARMDASGIIDWSRDLAMSSWDHDAAAITTSTTTALAEREDGSIVVASWDAFAEGGVTSMLPDGTPVAAFASKSYLPSGLVAMPAGEVLMGCYPRRIERLDAGLGLVDAVDLGAGLLPWCVPLLARTPRGDLLTLDQVVPEVVDPLAMVTRLSRIPVAPDPSGACPSVTTAPLDLVPPLAGPPRLGAPAIEFPLRDALVLSPANRLVLPACTSTPCVANACETRCDDGRDDDGDGFTDCFDRACAFDAACVAADSDGDGVPNLADCRPDDPRHAELPGAIVDLRVTAWKAPGVAIPRIRWSPPPSRGDAIDIVRGELAGLRASRSPRDGACIAQRWEGSMFQDYSASAHREALWWLARARNACGVGSWGSAELDAAGGCPP